LASSEHNSRFESLATIRTIPERKCYIDTDESTAGGARKAQAQPESEISEGVVGNHGSQSIPRGGSDIHEESGS
jgi:hypothetical protein